MTADPLPSWRETHAQQSIVEFAAAVTHPDSPDFVPERDRVAVFDNDGTLWIEQSVDAQLVFASTGRRSWVTPPASRSCTRAGCQP